ncbi:MAG: hypothetical protein D5R97_05265 [Candidatus Syntrophonatronum acetioxidans]|uniref:DUF6431 domain-containing protein n=1 Tax=Candidatus Syntrophonatronum acetioxidans TaxID=1795816 RepID=A0A424YEI8_9FIRM|nr:MAG: hypothetical protein D5R97_05265 [Candidatus Syntrophonatronum acetioxidans]
MEKKRKKVHQIIHNFNITLREYSKRGKNNCFPVVGHCPFCKYPERLVRHGFYWRNAVTAKEHLIIPILRLRCTSCHRTCSILPEFLIPYYQYTLHTILDSLREWYSHKKFLIYRQLLQFYRRRFNNNLNKIQTFVRDSGYRGIIPEETKKKAIKLLDMINAFPKAETFFQRFQNHYQQNLMAI